MSETNTQERGHVLALRHSADHTEEYPDWRYQIECLGNCNGWQECREDHAGLDPNDSDSPAYDQEEFEIHGVLHTWRYGFDWTVPFEGCVVAANDHIDDSAWNIARDHGPGRYLVDDDWVDDFDVILTVIKEID